MGEKITRLDAFQACFNQKNWKEKTFFCVSSSSDFDREEAFRSLKERFLENKIGEEIFQLPAEDWNQAENILNSLPFFGGKILFALTNLHAAKKPFLKALFSYLKNPSPSFIYFFSGESLPSQLVALIEANGVIYESPPLKPWEKTEALAQFAMEILKKEGKILSSALAKEVAEASGGDKRLLASELEKLSLYLGERSQVQSQDIEQVCLLPNPPSAWGIGQKILAGQTGEVLSTLHRLMQEGTPFAQLIRLLRSQIQTLFKLAVMAESGASQAELQGEFPYFRGKGLSEALTRARSVGISFFKKSLLEIDQAELVYKNSSLDPSFLIDPLVYKLIIYRK